MNADIEVMEFFPRLLSREESKSLIDRAERSFEAEGLGLWACEIASTGEFIGFVGLCRPGFESTFTPCVEVGWRLARDHWGKGYATEAAQTVTQDGFERLGLAEILSWTAAINLRSKRVMERIGMVRDPDQDFLHPLIEEGHPLSPHVLYRLSRSARAGARSPAVAVG